MTESSQSTKLISYSRKLNGLIVRVIGRRKNIERDMRSLQAKGLSYANTHWRDGKYLYLLYPSKVGEPRRREYVGADPKRVTEAKAAIERAEAYDALAQQLQQIDRAIVVASNAIGEAVNALEQRW